MSYKKKMKFILMLLVLSLCFAAYAFTNVYGAPDSNDACDEDSCDDIEKKLPTETGSDTDETRLIFKDGKTISLNTEKNQMQYESKVQTKERMNDLSDDQLIHVLITFTNAEHKSDFHRKFAVTISSIFKYSSQRILLYIIGDPVSQKIAKNIIEQEVPDPNKYKLASLDVDKLGQDLEAIIRPMQDQFSYKPGAYYNHVLFFLSVAMHRILPHSVQRVIMLDADLKFTDDIAKLYDLFNHFSKDNILGIARDGQPVYRHTFWQYRQQHPGSRVGEPPPNGLTGFNSGVLLLDLVRMRNSVLYNKLLSAESIKELSTEFGFKGHLGDQDFFTLIGMKYEQLFYVLPCQWNRQLCQWWRDKGYETVFDLYFKCDGDIKIYHGNCNTPIP